MRRVVVALAVGFAACAGPGAGTNDPAHSPDGDFAETERIGNEIFLHDTAAWVATDAATAELAHSDVAGWIVVRTPAGLLVRFVESCGSQACAVVDVQTDLAGRNPSVRRLEAPEPLPSAQQGAWQARELAIASLTSPCSSTYNSVTLPTMFGGAPAWRVYLLAATTTPGEIVIGGHHRYTVSHDGGTLLLHEPLSRACLTLPSPPADAELTVVTHLVSPEPTETHVFASLSLGRALIVLTEKGMFSVHAGQIDFLGTLPPAATPK